mmetsp:Transcript_9742/g.36258  ORF Transcript_9742/g.36258 Transcript_9742/m.36258 type:complete len:99 (-) Transcript_9742:180-476(-)
MLVKREQAVCSHTTVSRGFGESIFMMYHQQHLFLHTRNNCDSFTFIFLLTSDSLLLWKEALEVRNFAFSQTEKAELIHQISWRQSDSDHPPTHLVEFC